MRSAAFIPLVLASAFAHSLPKLTISKRDRHTNGATDHFKRAVGTHQVQKRQGTVGTNIFDILAWNTGGSYYANVTVGTPPQLQTVRLDTGSSDTYFDVSTAAECKLRPSDPNSCRGGTFDVSASTTYIELDPSPAFNASYFDGSEVAGPFGQDVVGIGDVLVSPVRFGLAQHLHITSGYAIGLLGIGYSLIEAVQTRGGLYQNIPEVLVSANVINSRLYSVYLNDDSAISGSVLFGGIDRSCFVGPMATINLLPFIYESFDTGVNQFITTVTAAHVTSTGGTTELWSGGPAGIEAYNEISSLPVLLDTGSTAWIVPQSNYDQIQQAFPYIDYDGLCSCEHAKSGDTLSLEFGGKITINVDVSEFLVPYIDTETKKPVPYDYDGNDACVFLIAPDSISDLDSTFLPLGDAILRSMYVVFDLDNGQVSIAQAALNATSEAEDIVTVQAGPSGVASAISGVMAASPNPYSVASAVQQAPSPFIVSAPPTPIGTASGTAALPGSAQQSTETTQVSTRTVQPSTKTVYPSAGPAQTSMDAGLTVVVPGTDFIGLWMFVSCLISIALGAGLMM